MHQNPLDNVIIMFIRTDGTETTRTLKRRLPKYCKNFTSTIIIIIFIIALGTLFPKAKKLIKKIIML